MEDILNALMKSYRAKMDVRWSDVLLENLRGRYFGGKHQWEMNNGPSVVGKKSELTMAKLARRQF